MTSKIIDAIITAIASFFIPTPGLSQAPSMAAVPRTNITLATFEPRTPPTAKLTRSSLLLLTAFKVTANSGSDVPTATIVKPINRGETFIFLAIVIAP